MPLRLIGRFDQRWRDTPVKNQQPPVLPLSLCIPLSHYPSFSLSIALSIPSLYIPSSLICPTFSLHLLSALLCLTLSCKHIHTKRVRAAVLFSTVFQLIPALQVVPQSCPEELVTPDRWPIALSDTHHTHQTGSINKHTAHTKAHHFLQYAYTNNSYKYNPGTIKEQRQTLFAPRSLSCST